MLELVQGLPGQMQEAERLARSADWRPARPRDGSRRSVVVAGMGGSGISAELLKGLLVFESETPIVACRDYDAPAAAARGSLFFAVSYSGNTEETLSACRQAMRRGCTFVAITSGGRLEDLARKAGGVVVKVPSGLPPRAALGYLFVPLLVGFEELGICRSFRADRVEALKLMEVAGSSMRRRAATIAAKLVGRLPVIYSTSRLLDACAERWRCQLNENAKVMCHTNVLPEHNHNEIVGMGAPGFLRKKTVLVALLDRKTHLRTRARLEQVLDITAGGYAEALQLEAVGRSALARLFSLLWLGDFVSVVLAQRLNVDSMPVLRIDELKRRMAAKAARKTQRRGR